MCAGRKREQEFFLRHVKEKEKTIEKLSASTISGLTFVWD